MTQCNSLLWNVTLEPLIVVFELSADFLYDSPKTVAEIINLPEIRRVIRDAAAQEGARLLAEQRKANPLPDDTGPTILKNLENNAIDAAMSVTKREALESIDYKRLNAYLTNLRCSIDQSGMGAFINRHEKLLVVTGTLLAVGGVAYMYQSRQGDKPVDWALDLTKSLFKGKLTGSLTGGISDIKFVPSKRDVVVKGYLKSDFEGIAAKLDLRFAALEDKVLGAGAGATVALPIERDLDFTATASFDRERSQTEKGTLTPFKTKYQLGLGVNIKNVGGQPGFDINIYASSRNDKKSPNTGAPMQEHRVIVGAGWEF